jgi:hypothetical protein
MNQQIIFYLLLVLHICGIATAIGMTLANLIAFRQFWKIYALNKEQGVSSFRGINKFQLFGMLGLLLAILTGIGMLWVAHGIFAEFFWFKIKMSLVLLLLINGFTLGRTQNIKLQKLISAEKKPAKLPDDVKSLKRNLQIFQIIQLSLFLLIITTVISKF